MSTLQSALRLRIDGTTFRDSKNREVTLHGINVAGDAKFPTIPDGRSHVADRFFDGDNVKFLGRPFTVNDARKHFARLRRWGYNTIRYIFTWEAIEHEGPGKYDEQWIQHTIEVLRQAKEYGFHVFMDPHQDVWSRFTGGSGAPMWTIYACGLDPKNFATTEAALVQNTWPNPQDFPKMIWATNYTRMACQVLFTLFFAGREFAPRAIIDGINIQDYLQNHLIAACKHLALRIREAGDLDQQVVIGWESLNEPNRGMIGLPDVSIVPPEQQLQKGTSPTAWQAILTGSGRACEISTWEFGGMGPYKSGSTLVDPQGTMAWLSKDYDESHYGWKRGPGWKLGQCLWAQHGVWDPSSDTLLKNEYFARDPRNGETISYEYFTNHWFMDYYRRYKTEIRDIFPETIMFCQPPVLELPPTIKGTADDDPNMVFTPHFYDGLTLMQKKWNRYWNVDVFGVLRGKYLSPAFAIRIGEHAIRNCLRDTLKAITKEGLDNMGVHPCLFSEIGIPYDMDDRKAYRTGDYTSQILAMDANHFALEGSKSNFTLWTYTAMNTHEWGDQWNGEDLSIFSTDDDQLPPSPFARRGSSSSALDTSSPSYSESHASRNSRDSEQAQANHKHGVHLHTPHKIKDMTTQLRRSTRHGVMHDAGAFRAAEAYVRPTPITTNGDVESFGFDLRNCEFKLALVASSSTKEDAPTEIFLPEYHFPRDHVEVHTSGGKWEIRPVDANGEAVQILKWWHAEGEQSIRIKGPKRRLGLSMGKEEEEGFLDRCREKGCSVM